jgi:hypothetical protein
MIGRGGGSIVISSSVAARVIWQMAGLRRDKRRHQTTFSWGAARWFPAETAPNNVLPALAEKAAINQLVGHP